MRFLIGVARKYPSHADIPFWTQFSPPFILIKTYPGIVQVVRDDQSWEKSRGKLVFKLPFNLTPIQRSYLTVSYTSRKLTLPAVLDS